MLKIPVLLSSAVKNSHGRRSLVAAQEGIVGYCRRNASSKSNNDNSTTKLWGGRFTGDTDPLMEKFNASIGYDKRLWKVDIQGSKAYATALEKAGILTSIEKDTIHLGLDQVYKEWENGIFELQPSDEDIHTANERRLSEIIGASGGKLHTGRSRNDQVATDVRLWLRDELDSTVQHTMQLINVAVDRAENEIDIIMPGYTHLQPAQPVRWSHWLLSHSSAWKRDVERLKSLQSRVNIMPLGSGALAGHPFDIDRVSLANDLNFDDISINSMDAVSDRDFVAEYIFCTSLLATHLSRFAEDLIVYSTTEFNFVKMSDAYATGSSLMPQKKNPDACELLRGKSGRMYGHLVTMLTCLKGIPSTYNKDLQEDKEALFDAVETSNDCIQIAIGVLSTLEPQAENMKKSLAPEMLATDLADYLVRKGVPFRETHHISGECVSLAEETNRKLWDLSLKDLQNIHEAFDEDVKNVWSMEASVETRNTSGGTSKSAVLEQIQKFRSWAGNIMST
jgi:argininosuccinate lyase